MYSCPTVANAALADCGAECTKKSEKKYDDKEIVQLASFRESAAPGPGDTSDEATQMPFIHHVRFWAKNPSSTSETDQLFRAIKSLGTLPMVISFHVGKPIITDWDRDVTDGSYTFSMVLVVENIEKLEEYFYHPLHQKFMEENKHLWLEAKVIDSESI